jgi:hypothetical protein
MMRLSVVAVFCLSVSAALSAQANATLRVAISGESNLRSNFIDSFRDAGKELGLVIEVVPRSDAMRSYMIIIAQESSVGGAAAATIALDADGDVVASVVRSGRLSGRGAIMLAPRS